MLRPSRPNAMLLAFLCVFVCGKSHGVGAKVPFVTLEAEDGKPKGHAKVHRFVHGSRVPKMATLELEASGGAYMKLKSVGDSVSWTNPVDGANAAVVRVSLPDAPNGGGLSGDLEFLVDGNPRQSLALTSKQAWIYRRSRTHANDPRGGGMPYKMYNEFRFRLSGKPIPKGSTIALKFAKQGAASEFNVDCIDLEAVGPARDQPKGSLSVKDFGAKGDGVAEDHKAIQACIDAARKQGRVAWMPPGNYLISKTVRTPINLDNATLRGAGMWHTTITRAAHVEGDGRYRSFMKIGDNTVLSDVYIYSPSVRKRAGFPGGGDYCYNGGGKNWIIERCWSHHTDAAWLCGENGVFRDNRMSDHWGDGVNVHNSPTRKAINLVIENCYTRGAGDDGLTIFANGSKLGGLRDCKILNSTSVACWWANGLRVAGGKDVVVRGNLICDAASNGGMTIGIFGWGEPLQSAVIEDNVVKRSGGWNNIGAKGMHGIVISQARYHDYNDLIKKWESKYKEEKARVHPKHLKDYKPGRVTVRNNTITDARRSAIYAGGMNADIVIEKNTIIRPAEHGILKDLSNSNTIATRENTVEQLRKGKSAVFAVE